MQQDCQLIAKRYDRKRNNKQVNTYDVYATLLKDALIRDDKHANVIRKFTTCFGRRR